MARSDWYARVRELTRQLVAWGSVTGTEGEREFAFRLRDLLGGLPYFAAHPDLLLLRRTLDDPLERHTLFALVRGQGPKTVILTGHYDAVSVENYGPLRPWAFDPEGLLPRLLEEVRASDPLAAQDLASGDFLPGRAALDMKSGLAAGMAVLERFSTEPQRAGNLLFMAVPDEEGSSQGMRSAVRQLPERLEAWGLEVAAAINLDAHVDPGDGSKGQRVFLGSVGKLLPTVFFVGAPTHAADPYSGVGANFLAAELIRLLEANPDFADGEAPPPVNLRQGDFKDHYDVTTPHTAFAAFNLLTHTWGPEQVLQRVLAATRQAMTAALETLGERAKTRGVRSPHRPPRVLTLAELEQRVRTEAGSVEEAYREIPASDTLEFSRQVTANLLRLAGLEGPAAVVGFGSLYYPPVRLGESPKEARLLEAVSRQAQAVSREFGTPIGLGPFFPGISDMSFLGGHDTLGALEAMAANTPAFGQTLHFDYSLPGRLQIPVVNIGPWGRDYHQRTERVYMPYSFGVLPELLWRVCGDLLGRAPCV